MPTFTTVVKANQIIFFSTVSIPQALSTPSSEDKHYRTLFDTGAQCSLISPKVVSELQLVTIGDASITPVHGKAVPTCRYRVRLDIPITSMRLLPGGGTEPFTDLRGRELGSRRTPLSAGRLRCTDGNGLHSPVAYHDTGRAVHTQYLAPQPVGNPQFKLGHYPLPAVPFIRLEAETPRRLAR